MNCYRRTAYVCTSSRFYLCLKLQCHLYECVCVFVFFLFFLVSIVHDRLDVVSWEESGDAVTDAFEPTVIVFLDYVDDGSLHEGQLILLVLGVVVDGHNWDKAENKLRENLPHKSFFIGL